MAKQIGIIKISGTIEGLNFYKFKGEMIVRKSGGGFTRERIRTSPGMQRTRENAAEFGNCSKVKKSLRTALLPLYLHHHDTSLHGRMMRMLQGVKALDEDSGPGKRCVGVGLRRTSGQRMFSDFAFSPKRRLSDLLCSKGIFDPADLCYSIASFSAGHLRFPVGATHAELLYGILHFDAVALEFTLSLGTSQFISRTDTFDLLKLEANATIQKADLNFAFCCVRFYDQAGGKLHILKDLQYFWLDVVAVF